MSDRARPLGDFRFMKPTSTIPFGPATRWNRVGAGAEVFPAVEKSFDFASNFPGDSSSLKHPGRRPDVTTRVTTRWRQPRDGQTAQNPTFTGVRRPARQ